jgi:hypothetical protein
MRALSAATRNQTNLMLARLVLMPAALTTFASAA